jgi:hypothetical protein
MAVVDECAGVLSLRSPPGMPDATRVICCYAAGRVHAITVVGRPLYLCLSLSWFPGRTTEARGSRVQWQNGTPIPVVGCPVLSIPLPIQLSSL